MNEFEPDNQWQREIRNRFMPLFYPVVFSGFSYEFVPDGKNALQLRGIDTILRHLDGRNITLDEKIEPFLKAEAEERKRQHGQTAPGRRKKNTLGKLTGVSGDTRDRLAKAVGMRPTSFGKAKAVVAAASA